MILNAKVIVFCCMFISSLFESQEQKHFTKAYVLEGIDRVYVLESINKLRTSGCKCGSMYYPAVAPLTWNDTLYNSAFLHAKSMYEEDYFSHISPDGKDVGDRLDDLGYKWHYAGENLAEGQKNFDEAMHDWIASPTHCKMMMNEKMREIGVAKYKKYWVQHFGTEMPPKTKRISKTYIEGGD